MCPTQTRLTSLNLRSHLAALLLLLFIASTNHAAESDTVTVFVNGIGPTYAEAEKDAMRLAIQKVFGTLVITERTVTNDQLNERDFSYTRGAIRDFIAMNVSNDAKTRLVSLEAKVSVSASEIGKRLIYSSGTQKMDGRRIASEIEKAKKLAALEEESFQNVVNIVRHLSEEISTAAFDVIVGKLEVSRQGPVVEAIVPVALYLNQKTVGNYCVALKSMMDTDTIKYKKKNGQWPKNANISINLKNSSCSGSFEMPDTFLDYLSQSVNSIGVCMSVIGSSGKAIDSAFFPSKQGRWSSGPDRDGVYVFGRNLIFDGSHGRGQSFELQLPERFLTKFSNSESINTKISTETQCKQSM